MKSRIQFLAPGFVTVVLILAGAIRTQADGTVNFGNNSSNKVINGQTSAPVTNGNNVKAALYWAPLGSSNFIQIGSAVNVGTPVAGLFVGGTGTAGAGTVAGNNAQFQVWAWGGGYATYEQARFHNGVLIGRSAVIANQKTGNPGGTPPAPPESLLAGGLTGFTLTNNVVTIIPPTMTCATNKTVNCGSNWVFDLPTAVDGCTGSNLTVAVLSTTTNGQCPQIITRTWAATNSCDTSFATCSQVVTVVDTTPPVITCASNKTVECGSNWNFDQPGAFDTCCTNVTFQFLNTNSAVISPCQTVWQGVWQAMDCCSNVATCTQTVTVVDTTPPTLTCASNKTVECGSNWNFDQPVAFDACSGTNVTVSVLSTVTNGTCPQVITQTWQAADGCGNSNTCSQVVTVIDTTPPVITCASNKTVECGSNWNFDPPVASDACSGSNVTVSVLSTVTNGTCPQAITQMWLATDLCGNTNTCTQIVTVVDTAPPVLTCAGDKTVLCGSNWSFDSPTAFDVCCGTNVTISVFSTMTNNTSPRVITQAWKITDCCSNSVYCSQSVTESLPLPVTLGYSLNSSGFHLVFTTETGPTYVVEYKDNLTGLSWTTLQTVTGDGLSHDVIDPAPLLSMRYYRVRIVCP